MPVSSVRDMAQSLLAQSKLQRSDVDGLLKRAMLDGKLTSTERGHIRSVVDKFAAQSDSGDAVSRLKGFLDIKGDSLRALANNAESNDGVVDAAEAKKIVELVTSSGVVSANGKVSINAMLAGSKLTDEARAVLQTALNAPPTPARTGALTDLGIPRLGGKDYKLSSEGYLTSGPAVTFDAVGALEMYHAAEALAAAPGKPFWGVDKVVKEKVLAFLDKAFVNGAETSALPETSQQRIRAAAATTLLELIEGASSSDGDLKKRAVDLYLKQALNEPMHGLRASMYFNLERDAALLDAGDVKRLGELKNLVVPQKPPYEQWFKDNGARQVNVRHYAHEECWTLGEDPIKQYQRDGYKVVEDHSTSKPKTWVLEKQNDQAPGGPVKARIEVVQSHDGIFEKMGDPKTNVILYTGHSNLGGNVSEELRLGNEEKGSKLVLMAMCRGKQNIHEVANKYPSAQFVTTNNPSYFSSVVPMALGLVDGCLKQRDYDGMKTDIPQIMDQDGKDNYFFPNEERRYAYYDVDKDGYLDGQGAHTDKLFNITLRPPDSRRTDGVVRPNDLDPVDIDAGNVDHAVQFLNTLATYHVDHGNNSSKLTVKDEDNFRPAGWFDGPASEKVRVKTEADGTVSVSVNKGLCDQSWAVTGTIVQYEVAKQLLASRNGGTLTKEDEARAMLFAGEYLSYMYCSQDEADLAIAAVAKDSKFFKGTTFEHLFKAVESDDHGYVTDKQMTTLIALRP